MAAIADPRRRAGLRLALLLGAEAATLVVLVRLGHRPPFDLGFATDDWARATPGDAAAAALRWVAVAAAAWLLLVTGCAALALGVACGTHRARAWQHVTRIAPHPIRMLVDRASARTLGVVVASTAAIAPLTPTAASASTPPAVTIVRDGRSGRLASLPSASTSAPADASDAGSPPATTDAPRTTRKAAPRPDPRPGPLPEPVAPRPAAVTSVVVSPGDDLWELAARELARASGRARGAVADVEIAPYWVSVCEANRDRLASGDVDLVFPGEVVELPPLE